MTSLPDGVYDVVVVDVDDRPAKDGSVVVEMAVATGPFAGRVLSLRRSPGTSGGSDGPLRRGRATDDPLSLLGLAGTLQVRDDTLSFHPAGA